MSGITDERKSYLKQEATDHVDQAIAAIQNELQKSADVVEVPKTALAYWLQKLQSMKKGIDDPMSVPWSAIWINGIGRGLSESGFPNRSNISEAISGAAHYYDKFRRFVI